VAKNLIIVESPTKTKTLSKFLGKDYAITATKGHIIDLPPKKLGVDPDNGFAPQYEVIEGKKAVIKALKTAAAKAEVVYLAPDPDREGEAIAWHIADQLKKSKVVIKRATFNEITKSAVLRGLQEAGELDLKRYNAQQARRVLDRLVGYRVSPFLWKTVCKGLSAGRVQSVALRLVCEREQAIRDFKPQEYWSITADVGKTRKTNFSAQLAKIDGKKAELDNKKDTEEIVELLSPEKEKGQDAKYVVGTITKQRKSKNPPPPYITSTMQQDAARRLRYSPKKTMMLAQQLYEGVDMGDKGSVGLITYMRTDSVRVAAEATHDARKVIETKYGEEYRPDKPRVFKTKGRAQDAHEAIRPTYFDHFPENIKGYLSRDQYRLYKLIWERFLASQMSAASIMRTSVGITAENETHAPGRSFELRAGAETVVFDGFLKVYEDLPEENGNGEQPLKLPELKKDDVLKCFAVKPEQHFTKPPNRFTEASLVRELESNGIGRPSTYAQIIATIIARNYVQLEKRVLAPTELGETVNRILVQSFPHLFNVEFTAQMEEDLDKIEMGEDDWKDVLLQFYKPFQTDLKKVESKASEIKASTQDETDIKCDKCGKPMVIKWSKSGKFLACSGFPDCRNTKPLENGNEPQETGETCEKCGSPMIMRTGRFGQFLACSAYPKCKNTRAVSTGVRCPEPDCTGQLVQRMSKRKKVFYSCSRYPKCTHATWDKPVNKECPACGHSYMVEKNTKARGEHLKCPSCKHIIEEPAETEKVSA